MKNNLVIACVGDTSLHENWLAGGDFDTCLIYYGEQKDKYKGTTKYYFQKKGVKLRLADSVYDELSQEYDYIFIPDDDLYMLGTDINRLFEIAEKYDLAICQPSILGYYSVAITLHSPRSKLRYVNWIEIMCPCFKRETYEQLRWTFRYNKSCWGIEYLWDKELGFPTNRQAVVDRVVAFHTRPCFVGDNYKNNEIHHPINDVIDIMKDHDLAWDKRTYEWVYEDMENMHHSDKYYPFHPVTLETCRNLHARRRIKMI